MLEMAIQQNRLFWWPRCSPAATPYHPYLGHCSNLRVGPSRCLSIAYKVNA